MTFPKGSLGAAAIYYASLGWAVFPLVPCDKVPLIGKKAGGNGLHDATTDPAQITTWWSETPDANVGLVTGDKSGIVVVDVDGENGEAALAHYGEIPTTVESRTGKGRHLLFRGANVRNSAGKLGPQLDVRGEGGYIVAPPSIHPNGSQYQWARGRHPGALELSPLPETISARLAGVVGGIVPTGDTGRSAVDIALHGVDEGGRNQALAEYVGRQFALGARELEVLAIARGINATEFRPPLPEAEVEAVVRSIALAHAKSRAPKLIGPASSPRATDPLEPVRMDVLEAMMAKAALPVDALPTMWPSWNRACRMYGGGVGLARGWHVVGAGGAGAGKSLIALNLTSAALRSGQSVGWVSLEMSREQLLLRLLGIDTGRRLRDLEPGSAFDSGAFAAASYEFMQRMEDAGASLWMAERPDRDMGTVERLMREAIDAGCRLLIIDYLQLVSVAGAQRQDDALRQVSAMVQSLAYRYDVTTLALSQFNRSTTADRDAPPSMHGLAGSSAIENDADQVLLIDHTTRKEHPGVKAFSIILDKNRHGPSTTIPVELNTNTLRITEASASVRDLTSWHDQRGA